MAQSANITSIEALRLLKAAVVTFEEEVQAAIVALEMEARRPVEWIEHDRKQYWPKQVRKASDEVSEARLALQRCELTISGEDNRSCYDERKALMKAKKRLEKCEEKVRAVRQWSPKIRKEVEEFEVQTAKLKQFLESDFVKAPAALARMADALDQYVQQGAGGGSIASAPASSASASPPESP
jgi:hypothetical protein